jgi:hypothetical protein
MTQVASRPPKDGLSYDPSNRYFSMLYHLPAACLIYLSTSAKLKQYGVRKGKSPLSAVRCQPTNAGFFERRARIARFRLCFGILIGSHKCLHVSRLEKQVRK